ncbi:helix-turn-helix domain-containing protein [Agarivorans sp. QJM3NY_25]|uniref:helix-turn-helix domain-containing protein n=1 Tax=Agarivorans sp. QJM3NY_25 TaxID=3421430 RepID=UPI003D7D8FC6
MITTVELLDGLKARRDIPSDYKLAKYLGITQQAVSKLRNGASMSEEMAFRIADDLEMDAELVVLSILLEKAKNERTKSILKKLVA